MLEQLFGLVKNVFTIGGIMFVFFVIYLYFNQDGMIYLPEVQGMCDKNIQNNPSMYKSPLEYNLKFKEVNITTKDGIKLYGWLVYLNENRLKNAPTVVYFQENAGSKKI